MSGAPTDDDGEQGDVGPRERERDPDADADGRDPGADAGAAHEDADGTGEDPAAHLDVDDGCGCAEVWEHLSERRADGK